MKDLHGLFEDQPHAVRLPAIKQQLRFQPSQWQILSRLRHPLADLLMGVHLKIIERHVRLEYFEPLKSY